MASVRELGLRFCDKALAMVLNLFPLTSIPAGLWMAAKCSSSNNTLRGNMSCFLGVVSFGMVKTICSPPVIRVAVVAMIPLTEIYFFLRAFLSADLVGRALKIPTPYSCNRRGVEMFGTICVSLVSIYWRTT